MPIDYKAIRQAAKLAGYTVDDVRDLKNELAEVERERVARPNAIRATAWTCHKANVPGCWPFWRHGFRCDYLRRVDAADYTVIPGYDELHQEVATEFPEFDSPDGEEKLWAFLLSPFERQKSPEDLWWDAVDMLTREPANECEFAFGANATTTEF